MKRKQFFSFISVLLILSLLLTSLASCTQNGTSDGSHETGNDSDTGKETDDTGADPTPEVPSDTDGYTLISADNGVYTFEKSDTGDTYTLSVSCVSGTAGACTVSGSTLTISGLTEDSVYALSGTLYGNIRIENTAEVKLELELTGLTVVSAAAPAIVSDGLDKLTLTAKKGTENLLADSRTTIGDTDISAAVYADSDLDIGGKGTLSVVSQNGNGIHGKDDLEVKNLTLSVSCLDNALKGNDGVTILSGDLTLIARQGDGIKTANSALSKKGKQKGSVTLSGGTIRIYAACDGIDAAYDVVTDETSTTLSLTIRTDRYSSYSEEVTAKDADLLYIRASNTSYRYSVKFENEAGETVWKNSTTVRKVGNLCYYPIEKPDGYTRMTLYLYTDAMEQGQDSDYATVSDSFTVNSAYDTIAIRATSDGTLRLSWTNYTTEKTGGGFPGGMGGMSEGNSDKGDHSTKGIKAANSVTISAGTITIHAYDDAIHANSEIALESGAVSVGDVRITGGALTLSSNDDAVHGDGAVEISGGSVTVLTSYEGVEGNTVTISGGVVAVVAKDDGINATATSGTGITIAGGTLSVLAGGDGLDSNSRESMGGILISGGRSVIVSTGNADSAIDTESGYAYTGGSVVAIGRSGGMNDRETTHFTPGLSTVGMSASLRLSADTCIVIDGIDGILAVLPGSAMNATVVCLGSTSATVSTTTVVPGTADAAGAIFG